MKNSYLFIRYIVVGLLLFFSMAVTAQSNSHSQKTDTSMGIKYPHAHDPSMAKEGDTYYVFGTGVGISTLYSKDLVHWKKGDPVFDALPSWVHEALPDFKYSSSIWAPDIIHYNGLWYLF